MPNQCKHCPYNNGILCDVNPMTCPMDAMSGEEERSEDDQLVAEVEDKTMMRGIYAAVEADSPVKEEDHVV